MPNRRTLLTKRIIKDSLVDMLKKKPIERITVSALCIEADINRSTFYSHYSDVCDVIEEIKAEFITKYCPFVFDIEDESISRNTFMKFFEAVRAKSELLSVLMNNTNIINDITQPARVNIKELYKKRWGRLPKSAELYLDAESTFLTFGFFAAVNRWLELGCRNDPSYLYDMLKSTIINYYDSLAEAIRNNQF